MPKYSSGDIPIPQSTGWLKIHWHTDLTPINTDLKKQTRKQYNLVLT